MSKILSIPTSMIGSHIKSGDGSTATFPVGSIVYTNISGSTYANAVIVSGSFGNATTLPTTITPNTTFTYGTASNLVCLGKLNTAATTAWVSGTSFAIGQFITNGGNTYYVTTAGSSTDGPTNTSGSSGALTGGALVVSYVSASTAWVTGVSYSANTIITHAGNMYLVTTTGSSDTAPTNISGSSGPLSGGSLVVSYIGKATVTGTQWTPATSIAVNTAIYWGGNLYNTTTAGTTDPTTPPTHTSGNQTNGSGTAAFRFIASYYSPGMPWIPNVTYPQYSRIYYGQNTYVVTSAGSSTSAPSGITSETLSGGDGNLSVLLICNIGSKYVINVDNILTVQPVNTYATQIKYLNTNGDVTNININSVSPDSSYSTHFSIMESFDKMAERRYAGSLGTYGLPLSYKGAWFPNLISSVFMS